MSNEQALHTAQSANQPAAFFYVDGIPTKGCWVDLEGVNSWEDVAKTLSDAGFNNTDDILCADAEGLARSFLGHWDCFDLKGYLDCKYAVTFAPDEAKAAYIDCFGCWDAEGFEDAYAGEWGSDEDFAEEYIESTGLLSDVPDALRNYFDLEAFSRDLMMDHSESGGYYFRCI